MLMSPDEFENFSVTSTSPVLEIRGLDKSFYATHAADNVSFSVNSGEIVALLGENGAGKSTVIKMLAGVYTPDSGDVSIEGKQIHLDGKNPEIAFVSYPPPTKILLFLTVRFLFFDFDFCFRRVFLLFVYCFLYLLLRIVFIYTLVFL
jgi:ABC-type multidrug transport system fused ATPase/permease subunit